MYTQTLPKLGVAGDNKDKQVFVKITNRKLAGNGPDGKAIATVFEVEADKFEYSQFGRVDTKESPLDENDGELGLLEAKEEAGGWLALLEIINSTKRDLAVNAGKDTIRFAETGEQAGIIERGLKASKDHSLKQVERKSAKEMNAAFMNLKANFASLTPEQIAAEVAAIFGQTA